MPEGDLLNDLLSSNPNEPATNGVVLLLRAEMKSEFKAVRSQIGGIDARLTSLEGKVDRIDTRLTGLEGKVDRIDARLTGLEGKVDRIDAKVTDLGEKFTSLQRSVELIAQQTALLVQRQA